MSILKGDFGNMKSLAIKIGGFPQVGKMDSFFKVVRDNKNSIKFSDISAGIGNLSNLGGMANGALGSLNSMVGSMTGGNQMVAGALGGATSAA